MSQPCAPRACRWSLVTVLQRGSGLTIGMLPGHFVLMRRRSIMPPRAWRRRGPCAMPSSTTAGGGTSLACPRRRSCATTCTSGLSFAQLRCSHWCRTDLCGNGRRQDRTLLHLPTVHSLQDRQSYWAPSSFGARRHLRESNSSSGLRYIGVSGPQNGANVMGCRTMTCAMCDQAPETVAHLFVGCVFSREVWFKLLQPLGLSSLMPMGEPDLGQWWIHQRSRLDRASRPLFDSLVLLVAWAVWKERNGRVFGSSIYGSAGGTSYHQRRED